MRVDPNQTYDDIRCRVCGKPWADEHDETCSRHKFRPGGAHTGWLAAEIAIMETNERAARVEYMAKVAPKIDDDAKARREVLGSLTDEWVKTKQDPNGRAAEGNSQG
jgi:hypothetical protein